MKNMIARWVSSAALTLVLCSTALTTLCGASPAQDIEIPEIGPDQLAFSVDNMDIRVDPGQDFYRYASGQWQDRMERPADKESIGADPETRPITFLFNGGPGASSVYLHIGVVGPMTIDIPGDGSLPSISAGLEDKA